MIFVNSHKPYKKPRFYEALIEFFAVLWYDVWVFIRQDGIRESTPFRIGLIRSDIKVKKIGALVMVKKSIFRKKSLEQISTPEQLDDYIKVTKPSVWVVLIATILLIAGVLVWAVFGKIEVNTENGTETLAPISYLIN